MIRRLQYIRGPQSYSHSKLRLQSKRVAWPKPPERTIAWPPFRVQDESSSSIQPDQEDSYIEDAEWILELAASLSSKHRRLPLQSFARNRGTRPQSLTADKKPIKLPRQRSNLKLRTRLTRHRR